MQKSRHVTRHATITAGLTAGLALLVGVASSAQAATTVGLGTAGSFVVLAGTGITNTGLTTLSGDLGSSPVGSVTGAADITFASGTTDADGGPTAGAKLDLATAYADAAGQAPTNPITADLAGLTLVPGVYSSASSAALSGALTLDAQNDPDAVWVFQAGSTLAVSAGAVVDLANGAQACNVFWQVGSSASLGAGATFIGTIMARTSITLATGATVLGRVLALDGAVTLDTNTITGAACAVPPAAAKPQVTAEPQVTAIPTGTAAADDSTGIGDTRYLLVGALAVVAVGATAAAARWWRKRNA